MNRGKHTFKNVVIYVLILMFTVFIASLCVAQTVLGRERTTRRELENYYQSMEKETVRQVRKYLDENGFTHSGVTLTRVVDEEENRFYTLTVHHGKIHEMDEEEREILGENLEQFYFAADNCTFCLLFYEQS